MKKKKLGAIILTILMWFIGIKGSIHVLTDNNSEHYNNLPMWVVYSLLGIYIIVTIEITIKTIIKLVKN